MGDAANQLRFGEWLISEGIVTDAQLEEGVRSQAVYGGRLGTNLVEVGYLGLDELAELLTRYHGLTLAPVPWLEAPDPKAIQLIPMALIRRHKMLPLRLEREALHIAMLDPRSEDQLEFVRAASHRQVVPYVLPEIRILYWLETHLQIDRHPRFVNLAARLRRTDLTLSDDEESSLSSLGRSLPDPGEATPTPDPGQQIASREEAPAVLDRWFEDDVLRPEGDTARADKGDTARADKGDTARAEESRAKASHAVPEERPVTPAEPAPQAPADPALEDDPDEELLLDELVVESPSPAPAREVVHGPVSPARVAELEALLVGAQERDAIVDLVLELARAYCEAAVLFLVQGGCVRPFRASGDGLHAQLEGIEVPLGVHSVFAHPAVTGFPFRGSPPEGGIDARLLEGLGRAHIQDLVVHPISIRDRVVNLLYCDNGASAFGESSVAALAGVADCGARAYERLILDRKKASRG